MLIENYLQKDIFTMGEAVLFTGLSRSTLYKLTMKRIIPYCKPGGKLIFFQKKDLESFMLGNMHKSKSQIAEEAKEFLSATRKNHLRGEHFSDQKEKNHYLTVKIERNEA